MIRKFSRVVCAAFLLALGIGAMAQVPAPPRKPHPQRHPNQGGMLMALARIPANALSAFVPLREEQKTRITEIQEKLKTDLAATRHPGTPPTPAEQAQRRQLNEKASADISAVLTAEQRSEIESTLPALDMLHASRVFPLAVLPQLNLTQDQIGKLRAAAQQTQDKIRDLPAAERHTQRPALLEEFRNNAQAILTPQQKETIANFHPQHPRKRKPAAKS
ncbi:MAG TPA: hypothetical protein VKT32_00790 [Chthonomonadaceae bacterium]|nr:hypothetical protein [Chthonomonadaceae bacterium]